MDPAPRVAGASRPCAGETANGDAWRSFFDGRFLLIALADGLGHGPEAEAAAALAMRRVAATPDQALPDLLAECHRDLRGSRGAALSLLRLDLAAGRMGFAGLGNVEARLLQAGREQRLIPTRGIVGAAFRTPVVVELALTGPWLAAVYSDGLVSRMLLPRGWDSLADLQPLAVATLPLWSRPHDDATLVLAASPLPQVTAEGPSAILRANRTGA